MIVGWRSKECLMSMGTVAGSHHQRGHADGTHRWRLGAAWGSHIAHTSIGSRLLLRPDIDSVVRLVGDMYQYLVRVWGVRWREWKYEVR